MNHPAICDADPRLVLACDAAPLRIETQPCLTETRGCLLVEVTHRPRYEQYRAARGVQWIDTNHGVLDMLGARTSLVLLDPCHRVPGPYDRLETCPEVLEDGRIVEAYRRCVPIDDMQTDRQLIPQSSMLEARPRVLPLWNGAIPAGLPYLGPVPAVTTWGLLTWDLYLVNWPSYSWTGQPFQRNYPNGSDAGSWWYSRNCPADPVQNPNTYPPDNVTEVQGPLCDTYWPYNAKTFYRCPPYPFNDSHRLNHQGILSRVGSLAVWVFFEGLIDWPATSFELASASKQVLFVLEGGTLSASGYNNSQSCGGPAGERTFNSLTYYLGLVARMNSAGDGEHYTLQGATRSRVINEAYDSTPEPGECGCVTTQPSDTGWQPTLQTSVRVY